MRNKVCIHEVQVHNFRHLSGVTLPIGEKVTLLAGQNGSSKSTLLGMICQPFYFTGNKKSIYTDNYHNVDFREHKTVFGHSFETIYSKVFRMSQKHDNPEDEQSEVSEASEAPPKKYSYTIKISGSCINDDRIINDGLYVQADKRESNTAPIRLVAGPGKSHESGEGNFPHPVIYVGLERLFPVALRGKIKVDPIPLSDDEKTWVSKYYNDILIQKEKSESVRTAANSKSMGKHYVGLDGEYYDSESLSAGQDNLNQIITAMLSFKRLKEKLGNTYKGGILLIDEIDVTLHPVAQEKILNNLIKFSEQFNVQVIATTHSLYLLQNALRKFKKNVIVNYVSKAGKKISVDAKISDYSMLEGHLAALTAKKTKKRSLPKINLFMEDRSAQDFFFTLVGQDLYKYFKIFNHSLPAGTIGHISSLKIPDLHNYLYIVDGDKEGQRQLSPRRPNLLCFPSNDFPEKMLYNYLYNLSEEDSFFIPSRSWDKVFRNHATTPEAATAKDLKRFYKSWYTANKIVFERCASAAFGRWIVDNKKECAQFCCDLYTTIKSLNVSQELLDKLSKIQTLHKI